MNNREKYKDELIETIKKDGKICGFMKKHGVLQMFGKDFAADVGVLRYFKGINACNPVERFVAWADGKTSVTANGSCTNWAFCELVENLEGK